MYLDAAKQTYEINTVETTSAAQTAPVFEKWENFPVSRIAHHGTACCELAREWLFAMDFSEMNGESVLTGPRWIRKRYNWGPTRWQIHWCEAIRQNSLDCGAQAALANEVFTIRGVKSHPVQLVQRFSKDATRHWTEKWDDAETSVHWINDDLIYHEGCAVETEAGEIKIWDASASWWINPNQTEGYGALLALRVIAAPQNSPADFSWGNHRITPNRWQRI